MKIAAYVNALQRRLLRSGSPYRACIIASDQSLRMHCSNEALDLLRFLTTQSMYRLAYVSEAWLFAAEMRVDSVPSLTAQSLSLKRRKPCLISGSFLVNSAASSS